MTITDAEVEAAKRAFRKKAPRYWLDVRDAEEIVDKCIRAALLAATQLSTLSAEVAALRSERANLIATKREQIDRIEDRATRAEEQLKAAREAMTRISDIKYPTVDTHYALKATIDYARDQSRLALSNHEVGK